MSTRFLFLDIETTGLDVENLTVLEWSWTVTDDRLRQLTPLRSRFSALTTDDGMAPVVPTQISSGNQGWTSPSAVSPIVRDMHRSSGLWHDWQAAPSLAVLRTVEDLNRLILDDLLASGWTHSSTDRLFLAGAGVSHFDQRVLTRLGVLVTDGRPVLYYRTADVSVAVTTLGIQGPRDTEDLAWMVESVSQARELKPIEITELKTDPSTAHLAEVTEESMNFPVMIFDKVTAHRAASDVAFALVLARCLRAKVA